MDKLKIIKSIVAVLTFLLIFGLLIALSSIFQRVSGNRAPTKEVILNLPEDVHISDFKVDDTKLYILTSNQQIKVIDTKSGKISLTVKAQ
jgi:hypothetical protein